MGRQRGELIERPLVEGIGIHKVNAHPPLFRIARDIAPRRIARRDGIRHRLNLEIKFRKRAEIVRQAGA